MIFIYKEKIDKNWRIWYNMIRVIFVENSNTLVSIALLSNIYERSKKDLLDLIIPFFINVIHNNTLLNDVIDSNKIIDDMKNKLLKNVKQ